MPADEFVPRHEYEARHLDLSSDIRDIREAADADRKSFRADLDALYAIANKNATSIAGLSGYIRGAAWAIGIMAGIVVGVISIFAFVVH